MAVTQRSLDQWLGEDKVGKMVREGPSYTYLVTTERPECQCGVYGEQ